MRSALSVLLAHPGTQYAPRLAGELGRHDALGRYVTGWGFSADSWFARAERLAPARLRRTWSNRRLEGVPSARVHTLPRLEFTALRRLRRGEPSEMVLHERNAAFQRAIPDQWIEAATHVIGFDTSSWILAERCRDLRRPFILDQSIGHPRAKEQVYAELRARFPAWAETIPQKNSAHVANEETEHALATAIVAPSGFVRCTLVTHGVDTAKIHVIPFGTDLAGFTPAPAPATSPVVFLFAGSLTARKGVPVLLEAWRAAKLAGRAELWLAGPGRIPTGVELPEAVRLLGQLSRGELAAAMQRAHAFVFPSFFEGLALVQLEALAIGLPVVGTAASGAEDIVVPEETGLAVPTGDVAQLTAALQRLATDTGLRRAMRDHCLARRAQLSWSTYGERWLRLLVEIGRAV